MKELEAALDVAGTSADMARATIAKQSEQLKAMASVCTTCDGTKGKNIPNPHDPDGELCLDDVWLPCPACQVEEPCPSEAVPCGEQCAAETTQSCTLREHHTGEHQSEAGITWPRRTKIVRRPNEASCDELTREAEKLGMYRTDKPLPIGPGNPRHRYEDCVCCADHYKALECVACCRTKTYRHDQKEAYEREVLRGEPSVSLTWNEAKNVQAALLGDHFDSTQIDSALRKIEAATPKRSDAPSR